MPPNNQNNKENSVILHLESLNQQYDTLLIRYKEAISNYTNLVQQKQNNSPEKYSLIKGNSFWGSGQAGSQSVYTNVNNASGCQALCSKTSGCSGATFNPGTNGNPKCYLRSGNGSMVPSAATDYAIIPLSTEYLLNIQNLNQQLTEINNQIMELINNKGASMFTSEELIRYKQNSGLKKKYNELLQEREMIEEQLKTLQDLEQEENSSDLVTNSNYLSYLLLLSLAIFVIIMLFKFTSMSNSNSNTQYGGGFNKNIYFFIFGIFLISFVIYYYKK
jgi:hypothetical protein